MHSFGACDLLCNLLLLEGTATSLFSFVVYYTIILQNIKYHQENIRPV